MSQQKKYDNDSRTQRATSRFQILIYAIFLVIFFFCSVTHFWPLISLKIQEAQIEANLQNQNLDDGDLGPDNGTVHNSPQIPDKDEIDYLDHEELAQMQVNELGKIMIIMYHDVNEYEGEWCRSRENFRNDLRRFHDLGYSLIPLSAYLTGNIDVPAGRTPLVLTFDDGTRGQLTMMEKDGEIMAHPDCAVGILLEFSREHPEFGHAATFFINFPYPFGDASRVKENLTYLLENGMEIGNHTINHKDLSFASPEEMAKEIGSLANEVRNVCGYEMNSLALPYGGYPRNKENLMSGEWDGHEYLNLGILLVGAEPAPSPFSEEFNPETIPRIQGSQDQLDKWLNQLEKYPDQRFISDGLINVITVHQSNADKLDPDQVGNRSIIQYDH